MRIILGLFLLTIFSCDYSKTKFEKYDEYLFQAMLQFNDNEFQKSWKIKSVMKQKEVI